MNTKTLIIGLLFCYTNFLFAQEPTLSLSLDDAKKYALKHNRTIQNASLDIQIAEASRWQTISTMLPQIKASYDYNNMCGHELEIMGMPMAMPPYGTLGLTASIAFTGSQITGLQLQKIATEMSNINLLKSEQTITSTVIKLYLSILAMESTVDLLKQNLKNLESLHTMTEKAVLIGVAEQTDADKLLVQLATMRTSINSTKNSLEMLYNSLILQLGAEVDTKITLTDKIENILNINDILSIFQTDFVLDSNFNYLLLNKNLELSKKQVQANGMNFSPVISAYYQYSNKKYYSDEKTMDMTPPNLVGFSVSIPIWTSWQRMSKINEAKISYKKTQKAFEDTKNALLIQDKQLRYNLSSAYENYETQNNNLDVNKRVFNNIVIKYEQGTASSLEVTNASSNLILAQSSYISAILELINAKIELENLLNK